MTTAIATPTGAVPVAEPGTPRTNAGSVTAELYKIRRHRTPWVLGGLLSAAVVVPSVVMFFVNTSDPEVYTDTLTGVFGLALSILAAVFGGWLVGHEYRQGTLRRMASIDARRGRLIANKAAVGGGVFVVGAALAAALGYVAMAVAASLGDVTLATDGIVRDLAGSLAVGLIYVAFAFVLSLVFRNDSYAMLTVIGALVVFSPLLMLIPEVGPYLPGTVIGQVGTWMTGAEGFTQYSLSNTTALAVAAGWLAGTAALGVQLFRSRDI